MNTDIIEHIDHHGIVASVDPAYDKVTVRIDDRDECGTCPAANLCTGGREASGLITVTTPHASSFRKGDEVIVRGTEQMHRKAIMLATVLPCIALVAVMVAVYILTANQLAAAVCGLTVTVFFFVILFVFRNRIAHEFNFSIFKNT